MRAWQSLLRGIKTILRLRRDDKAAVFLKGILNFSCFWGLGGIFKSRIPLENSRIPAVFFRENSRILAPEFPWEF